MNGKRDSKIEDRKKGRQRKSAMGNRSELPGGEGG